MYRDVSAISEGDCIQVFDDQTIKVWDGSNLLTYKLISDKYQLVTTDDISGGGVPTNVTCVEIVDISQIPSRFDFMTPVFHLMAIISVLFIVWAAYRLVLRPWYRPI